MLVTTGALITLGVVVLSLLTPATAVSSDASSSNIVLGARPDGSYSRAEEVNVQGAMALLMLSAIGAHIRVSDPAVKSLPALAMFVLCTVVLVSYTI